MGTPFVRTRIAPTPSGYLHKGNAFSFILTWLLAKKQNGKVLLRIDDIDASRTRTEYLEDIFQTLDWLGIEIDEGPSGVEDFSKNFSQHLRLATYNSFLEKLKSQAHLFACDCSRSQIKKNSSNGQYPGTCRKLGKDFDNNNCAWRIVTSEKEKYYIPNNSQVIESFPLTESMNDFVVRKKDGLPAYQIASLVDDLHFKINFIVRGNDLKASTSAQLFLAKKLGASSFLDAQFVHHPLLLDATNEKLSKSDGATSIKYMRENGLSKKEFLTKIGRILQLQPSRCEDLRAMLDDFNINSFLEKK